MGMKQAMWYVRHYTWIGLTALWVIGFMEQFPVSLWPPIKSKCRILSSASSVGLAVCTPVFISNVKLHRCHILWNCGGGIFDT
jgi:hypothetical protein